ncbi:NAD(P)/FAD-dependent oxidoreductase [Candidatus Woesearchaeota archaeon]|nr:NAD(P)/FAD-dependent oxidoreductase [Candidatus Woesearchaeota archaeon]
MIYDSIVVGAGLAGLSIASLLSNHGHKVICLEKSNTLGGRARIWKKDGFTYEYGIHVLRYGEKGACGEVMRRLGVNDFKVKKLNTAIYENGEFYNFSSGGLSSLLSMNFLTNKDKAVFIKELLKLTLTNIKPLYDVSVSEFIKERGYSSGLKKIFESLSTSMLSCPDTKIASAGELAHHLRNVVHKRYAIGYPEGGFETIINKLVNKIEEKNQLITGVNVIGLVKENGKIVGVTTETERIYGKNVILATPEGIKGLTGIDYAPVPTSGISIDYALNTDEYKEDRVILTQKVKGVAMFASNVDKTVAPEGKSLLTFFSPRDYYVSPESQKRSMEEVVEEMFPGIHSKVENKRVLNLLVVDGVELTTKQNYYKRLETRVSDGLYVVGDSVKAHGNGGEIAFNSALECYKEVMNNG